MGVSIVFVQEQILTFIPNVQFTTVLILVFASVFTFREMVVFILVYVLLDNMVMAGLNPLIMTPMFLAWLVILAIYYTLMQRTTNEHVLAFFGLLIAPIYGFMFVPFVMLQTGITELWPYILADFPFQFIMATANFLTILWVFAPLHARLKKEIEYTDNRSTLTQSVSKKI